MEGCTASTLHKARYTIYSRGNRFSCWLTLIKKGSFRASFPDAHLQYGTRSYKCVRLMLTRTHPCQTAACTAMLDLPQERSRAFSQPTK